MPSRPLTEQELQIIICNTDNLMHRCIIVIGAKTGFRISELLSLTAKDVSQKEGDICDSITVKRCNMKGKIRSRTIPLHKDARLILKEYLAQLSTSNEEKLFPISRFAAHRILKQAAKKSNLKGRISTHSMRKCFAMRVYEKTGKDIVCVQRALGHASLASTTKYLSVNQDIIDAAILSD